MSLSESSRRVRVRKPKRDRGRVRQWTPRWLPRDKYDVRLLAAIYSLLILALLPIGVIWAWLPFFLGRLFGFGSSATFVLSNLFMMLWCWGALRALITRVETADDGLRVVGGRSRTIGWDEIEAVEPLNRWETVRAMLRWPFWEWNLQMSGGFTFGGYVRIKAKSGSIVFGAKNRAEFLEELHTRLYRASAPVQIPVWQWHTVTAEASGADVANVQQAGRE